MIKPAAASRTVASTSSTSLLHSSAILQARAQVDLSRKLRRQQKIVHKQEEADKRPHPITGLRRGEEDKWKACDLAKILVSEEDLTAPPVEVQTAVGTIPMPRVFSYGIREPEAALLFKDLPELSSEQPIRQEKPATSERFNQIHAESAPVEALKSAQFSKVVDLRNANADGIHFENRQRIIRQFSAPDRPFNPGRQEVQGMLTVP